MGSKQCECGCGNFTRGGRYQPGHDARHVNQLVRRHLLYENVWDEVATLSDPLHTKFHSQLANRWAACRKAEVVDGLDIRAEYARLLTLETWQGRFDVVNPRLLLRWAAKPPTTRSWRLGSADIVKWFMRLNLYPGLTSQDVRETMVHELAHLFVGLRRNNGHNEWHGIEFQTAMRKGFAEAYGVWVDVAYKARFGGQYAAALVAQPHT